MISYREESKISFSISGLWKKIWKPTKVSRSCPIGSDCYKSFHHRPDQPRRSLTVPPLQLRQDFRRLDFSTSESRLKELIESL